MTAAPPERIVSLLAAGTEILHAVGAGDRLVGVSHECDHPESVRRLPRLTSPRLEPARPGGEISRDLEGLVAEGVSPYRVDAEALRKLRPDLVVTQDQCEVCAVSPRDLEEALGEWLRREGVRVVSLRPHRLEDVWEDVRRVGEAAGRGGEGRALAEALRGRIGALAARTAGLPRPSAAHVEWMDPLMLGGGWSPELVEAAGGSPVGPAPGEPTRRTPWPDLLMAAPEVVVAAPCGYPAAKTRREIGELTGRPGWDDLPAVRDRRTWICDGNALFNRSGPRLVETAELLAEILHPEVFPARLRSRWAEPFP